MTTKQRQIARDFSVEIDRLAATNDFSGRIQQSIHRLTDLIGTWQWDTEERKYVLCYKKASGAITRSLDDARHTYC